MTELTEATDALMREVDRLETPAPQRRAPLRCRLRIHDWSTWSAPTFTRVVTSPTEPIPLRELSTQQRECYLCDAIDYRLRRSR